ncbi:hypothetical protein [Compostimonas suwonensis]|uniref:Uncharacterized protein n=1 Tax=Compostimonas suwonensis TaxID=1048394 RepID=A0A2M9C086_9MICO|nr:hypothetical protein [Compostimonas suwonensis]PJJ63751.1 hypothetical protein CLV54_1426 [Compostimonas suwonensis]
MDACAELCSLAARLAREKPTPRRFLIELGTDAAGIRTGPFWFLDAAVGGRNVFSGAGFRSELDDGTRGQVRHFAGIVAVSARIGPGLTRWLSVHVGRDEEGSADGRLTDEAIEFAGLIRSGGLALSAAPDWISQHLCARSGG